MITTTTAGSVFLDRAPLCPPPLHIQKKSRKATFRRRIFHDIIDEIKSDIWESPPDFSFNSSVFDWAQPLRAPLSWTVTPLPVCRAPGGQPLTVRKNRNSRSSASGSSFGDQMAFSRKNSHVEPETGDPVRSMPTTALTPWPLIDVASSEPAHPLFVADSAEHMNAQQALEKAISNTEGSVEPLKRRMSSKLRSFTSGLPLLRRHNTGETSAGISDMPGATSPTAATALAAHDETEEGSEVKHPDDEAFRDYLLRNARKLFPEVKLLTEEYQDIGVAIEIEGVLHNRKPLPDTGIDVIFVVDNGYYVTPACLERSLDAVNGALIFRDLTSRIAHSGSQLWHPPRPNPTMGDVILGIAGSMAGEHLKAGRTHVIVLSPAAHVLHKVSKSFPDIYIHRINPAFLPYRREPEFQDTICLKDCCKNVFASNWSKYQSTSGRIKRILKNARSEQPVGELLDLKVEIRTKAGCEILVESGSREIRRLFPGQVHTLFVWIRINKDETQSVDLNSDNPILNSCLDANGLRQELQNCVRVGATKVNPLDVQLLHRSSLHPTRSWMYTEAQLILTRELGGLAPLLDTSMEFYKRQLFCNLSRVSANEAKVVAEATLNTLPKDHEQAKMLLERMSQEIELHLAIRKYEKEYRQRLPLCPGPTDVEASHKWLHELWARRRNKRSGSDVA
ncbi:hypothetical protein J4E81_005372 [Alternaria sp. BMP 2799]|nr:hypothetical protein J4E81_005372 [Alternaria sp. BMP 2799]